MGRVITPVITEVPPWSEIQNKIIENFPTNKITPDFFERYLANSFPNFLPLYTDGSKTSEPEESVAAGLWLLSFSVC